MVKVHQRMEVVEMILSLEVVEINQEIVQVTLIPINKILLTIQKTITL
ncbi:hypothetical protein MiYa_04534 [Microcystis aeruginosa NIES-2519]|uniref:Uncharacterized protein n=1 Tax=Microcystis aeruginosa NIES-2519 TaxID=2303981 RepID=A0A5A5RKU9_MICAE|nr:hypothetical protein MiYa_04534 [Microcystis aeruginosa NIES-2519]GCA86493.1 hypothetical protein MiHa_04487 [Microcystis aeruginosa NIES-2522]